MLQGGMFGDSPGLGGSEVAVSPFLGEPAGSAEHARHGRPTNMQFGEPVDDHGRTDVVGFEQL
jgi:hypothetical protein